MQPIDLLKSHVDAYTKTNGTVVNAHDDNRVAASKPAPIGTHAAALRASSKPGDLDHEDNQYAADIMDKGDHKQLSGHLKGLDTAARDHILDHVHPDHWSGLGFDPLNKPKSIDAHNARFPAKAAKPAKAPKAKPAPAPAKAADKPAEFGIHHSELKEGDHLFDKHGQKVDEVEGFTKGVNSAVVHTRAGYSHSTNNGFLRGLSNKKPT